MRKHVKKKAGRKPTGRNGAARSFYISNESLEILERLAEQRKETQSQVLDKLIKEAAGK